MKHMEVDAVTNLECHRVARRSLVRSSLVARTRSWLQQADGDVVKAVNPRVRGQGTQRELGARDIGRRHEPSHQAMASKTLHTGRSYGVLDPEWSPRCT
jgi:hypothetical protein